MNKKSLKVWNLLILIILLLAFFLRIYRIESLLDFHFDQGRDAKVIWDLWNSRKLFLIGPVTGIEGVFLGPFYYYLISPFYLISKGNPVIVSIFLSSLTVIALYVLYKTGEELKDKRLGLIALLIGSFSHYIIFSNRWLSNPTPIFLTSILIFYSMLKIVKKDKKNLRWYLTFLLVGMSFHFEAASAAFYIPVLIVFLIWQKKAINKRTLLISLLLFFSTFIPQLFFNFRHDNLLVKNVIGKVFDSGNGENVSIFSFLLNRIFVFANVFANKIFIGNALLPLIFGLVSVLGLYFLSKKKENKSLLKLFYIFLGIPAVCYFFYRGNNGVLYDYYFTGYYLIIILLFSYGLWWYTEKSKTRFVLYIFFILFLFVNLTQSYKKLTTNVYQNNNISLTNQLNAITWIYQNSLGKRFNVDVYVPPVIPSSYDYLFLWYESKLEKSQVLRETQGLESELFLLYEVDPPHPERLDAWLARQMDIATTEEVATFGGITVEKRLRK